MTLHYHPRMRSLLVVLVVTFVTAGRADADKLSDALGKLATAARCSDKASPWRPWCIAATGWATGKPGELPKAKVMLGLTIELQDGKDTAKQLHDAVGLSAFIVKDGKVMMRSITPSNDDDKKAIFEAVFTLSSQFKGKSTVAKVPKDLAAYANSLTADYPATKTGGEWTWKGKSAGRARQVGDDWVVVETPDKQDGFFVTILTDAWASE